MQAPPNTGDADLVVGCTDGFRQGYIEGWAWHPNRPHDMVVVELLVDGTPTAEATACLPRPDLATAGIGHGQHAFAIPFTIEPDAPPAYRITVRAKGGAVLEGGAFDLVTDEETRQNAARRRSLAYLEQVFGPFTSAEPPPPRLPAPPRAARLNFVLYSARGAAAMSAALGMPEYSYVFVMRGYREVLRRLGTVHTVRSPAEAEAVHERCLARGESCLLLSFAPPQSTALGLRCPTVPVIAWEFSSIPDGAWDGDPREDWRLVLRETGRALTISDYAARVVRAGMGASFPVLSIPTPVWDRLAALRALLDGPGAPQPGGPVTLALDGFIWDSRTAVLAATSRAPPPPQVQQKAPAPVLLVRGAQLAMALASEAEADAAASASAAQKATAEPATPEPVRKGLRKRVGITLWYAKLWYREAVRDGLPGPVARLLSTAVRVAVALRRPAAPVSAIETPAEAPAPAPSPSPAPVVRGRFVPAQDAPPFPEPDLARFSPDPMPDLAAAEAQDVTVQLDGIVFTAVLSPKDGRKNWQDIVTAFADAFRDVAEATLVLKMIGADASYWWWEFNGEVRRLPAFKCRILVLSGYLDDDVYQRLIAATHFVVNASLAEGQCLPLVEFMSGRRPAIAPCHTAMLDYITPQNALIVASAVEFCAWPHDPRNQLITTRHRIEWPSLRDAYREAYRIATEDSAAWHRMARDAADSVRAYCSDAVLAPKLAAFLGLGDEALARAGWTPLPRLKPEALP